MTKQEALGIGLCEKCNAWLDSKIGAGCHTMSEDCPVPVEAKNRMIGGRGIDTKTKKEVQKTNFWAD